jgi:hypothetical protein
MPAATIAALALISLGAQQKIPTPSHTNLSMLTMCTRIFDVESSFTLQQNFS